MMEEYLYYFITFISGLYVGWCLREGVAFYNIRKTLNAAAETAANIYIPIKVELDASHIYVYNKDTSEYLASAQTASELESILSNKYPGKLFSASTEDLLKLQK